MASRKRERPEELTIRRFLRSLSFAIENSLAVTIETFWFADDRQHVLSSCIIWKAEEGPMSTSMKDLGIDRMTPQQRVNLALEIWESLGDDRPIGKPTAEQQEELARRDAELDADPTLALTWDQIRASVDGKR